MLEAWLVIAGAAFPTGALVAAGMYLYNQHIAKDSKHSSNIEYRVNLPKIV